MSAKVVDALVQENRLLQNQLNQLRYFLVGSHGLKIQVPDLQVGQSLYCGKEELHHIAAGLLAPSVTCADIGPGLRPQRLLDCPVHILVEPWRLYADQLVTTYPDKLVVNSFATPYLGTMLDNSIDTIFLLDVIEHIEKEEGKALLQEALRVARVQVVVFTPLGFMPHEGHESDNEWGDGIENKSTQRHVSGWLPQEFDGSVNVICENYHSFAHGKYGAFYSILPVTSVIHSSKLILVSEELQNSFAIAKNDILVVDVKFAELSHMINRVPKHNMLVVPLELIAEQPGIPMEILRRTIINFPVLLHHFANFEMVEAIGSAAQAVLHRMRNDNPSTHL